MLAVLRQTKLGGFSKRWWEEEGTHQLYAAVEGEWLHPVTVSMASAAGAEERNTSYASLFYLRYYFIYIWIFKTSGVFMCWKLFWCTDLLIILKLKSILYLIFCWPLRVLLWCLLRWHRWFDICVFWSDGSSTVQTHADACWELER